MSERTDEPVMITDDEMLAWVSRRQGAYASLVPTVPRSDSAERAAAVERGLRSLLVRSSGDGVRVGERLDALYSGLGGIAPVTLVLAVADGGREAVQGGLSLTPAREGRIVTDSVDRSGVHTIAAVPVGDVGRMVRWALGQARESAAADPRVRMFLHTPKAGTYDSFVIDREGTRPADLTVGADLEPRLAPEDGGGDGSSVDPVRIVEGLLSRNARELADGPDAPAAS